MMTTDATATTRPRATNQLPLTRNHLYALGALALSLAVLSFFVGFSAGRGKVTAPPAPPVPKLISEEVRSGDLEVLLAGVEHAGVPEQSLSFPAELPRSDAPLPPPVVAPEGEAPVVAAVEPVAPPPPAFPPEPRPGAGAVPAAAGVSPIVGSVPTSGWSIQVAQNDVEGDADRYVETLRAADLPAYKVVALVDGRATWRVRIGGYGSKDAATAALTGVASKAGVAEATVTPAP